MRTAAQKTQIEVAKFLSASNYRMPEWNEGDYQTIKYMPTVVNYL